MLEYMELEAERGNTAGGAGIRCAVSPALRRKQGILAAHGRHLRAGQQPRRLVGRPQGSEPPRAAGPRPALPAGAELPEREGSRGRSGRHRTRGGTRPEEPGIPAHPRRPRRLARRLRHGAGQPSAHPRHRAGRCRCASGDRPRQLLAQRAGRFGESPTASIWRCSPASPHPGWNTSWSSPSWATTRARWNCWKTIVRTFGDNIAYRKQKARVLAWAERPTPALGLVAELEPTLPDDYDLGYTRPLPCTTPTARAKRWPASPRSPGCVRTARKRSTWRASSAPRCAPVRRSASATSPAPTMSPSARPACSASM